MDLTPRFSVSEFLEVVNQTLDYAFPAVEIEGEVSSFKTSKDRWVFFDLKDRESIIGCFMPIHQLRVPLEDGMKVIISFIEGKAISVQVLYYCPKDHANRRG